MSVEIYRSTVGGAKALAYGIALFGLAATLQPFQISSFLLTPFSRRKVFDINSKICGIVWLFMQYIFEKRHKARVTFSGDRIPDGESALVMSNHRSWTDFYLLHSVAIRRKMLAHCKYFVKDSLKWLPFFGWGMWMMGMVFVKRNWVEDQSNISKMFSTIKTLQPPVWIISFIEGSRLTQEKLLQGQLFSKERNLPIMKNLLVPRTKGFVKCIQELRNTHVKYIYDFTIAYAHPRHNSYGFGEPPNMIRVHSGVLSPAYDFHVHVRRYPLTALPKDEASLTLWIRDRFVEKDQFLELLKERWVSGIEEEVWNEEYF